MKKKKKKIPGDNRKQTLLEKENYDNRIKKKKKVESI